MHQYIEAVRTETESAAGAESYLSAHLFLRMQKEFGFEDDGDRRLESRDDYELIQHQAINCLKATHAFDPAEETLAWQGALLRHTTLSMYHWWLEYKNSKFQGPDFFADGDGCMAIESACERAGLNPTESFTWILEIEHLLVKLCTGPDKIMLEQEKFWAFRETNLSGGENPFSVMRVKSERESLTLSKVVGVFKEVIGHFRQNAKKVAGAHHLLWMNAVTELQSMSEMFVAFVDYKGGENVEASLSPWLDSLFPARLSDGTPNPLFQSELHHQVIVRMTQATQMMVQHVLKKLPVFQQRDEVMVPFVLDRLEAIKRTCLVATSEQLERAEVRN